MEKEKSNFYMDRGGEKKDTKAMERTIADGNFGTGGDKVMLNVIKEDYNEAEERKKAVIDSYNMELQGYHEGTIDIDADYGGVDIVGYQVMLRVFAIGVVRSKNGLYLFSNAQVPVPAKSGQGILSFADSPYNYSHRAVVVNAPSGSRFKVGDIVQLNDLYLKAATPGNADSVVPVFGYATWDYLDRHFVADCKVVGNKHFGYMLMPEQNIGIVLSKSKREGM
jgi:hypothetical protein